jgi:AcrR family transcriptional regulator
VPIAEGGPTRRRLRRERTDLLETRILDAAVEEFAEHGFAGARIERVSAAAGTVDRMLYYYYGNKERLYQAVLAKIYEDMIGAQREFVTPEDPVEGMRQLVLHSWDHYLSHPNLVRLLMNENLLRGKHIRQAPQVVESTTLPLVQTVSTLLEPAAARGLARAHLRCGAGHAGSARRGGRDGRAASHDQAASQGTHQEKIVSPARPTARARSARSPRSGRSARSARCARSRAG